MKQKMNFKTLIFGLIILLSSCTKKYDEGIEYFNNKKYNVALICFKEIEKTDENYNVAQGMITKINSLLLQKALDKSKQDSIKEIAIKKKEQVKFKSQLESMIADVHGRAPSRDYILESSIENKLEAGSSEIAIELNFFTLWSVYIKKAESQKNDEINILGKKLKAKVIALQKSEFPKMRKYYADLLKDNFWKFNIKVTPKGNGYNTLEFQGGRFADNANKEDFQGSLSAELYDLRFKRIIYKWYEYDDEYTYYSLKTGQDSELDKH